MAPALRAYVPDLSIIPGCDRGSDGLTMKIVLLGLADGANEDGTNTHPGVRTLAEFAQCHTATVVRALRGLEHLGAIHKTAPGGPGICATYTVNLEWVAAQSLRASETRKQPSAPRARKARAPEARSSRAPEARSSVLPSDTSCPAASSDHDAPNGYVPPWFIHRFAKYTDQAPSDER